MFPLAVMFVDIAAPNAIVLVAASVNFNISTPPALNAIASTVKAIDVLVSPL